LFKRQLRVSGQHDVDFICKKEVGMKKNSWIFWALLSAFSAWAQAPAQVNPNKPEGKAQADSKAQHTRQYVSISRGLQRRHRVSDGVMKPLLKKRWSIHYVGGM
jgi:hypothetical protein